MVVSPVQKQMFLIDVKGLYRINPWLVKRKTLRAGLFYVLAYVPADLPNEFFVLTQEQSHELINSELARLNRPGDYPVTGFSWQLAGKYRNAWNVLPV